ncbi:MAG: tetratricopeptide repeat protein [candidate division WOR-3 bacterium]
MILFFFSALIFVQSSLLNLADSLYSAGFYFTAATEYERFLYHFPSDSNSDYVRLRLGISFLKTKESDKAEKIFRTLRKSYFRDAQLSLAQYYIQHNELNRAKTEIQDLLLFSQDSSETRELQRTLGQIAIKQNDWQEAEQYFRLAGDSLSLKRIQNLKRLPRKNPTTAVILSSILPGAGEIYCGHYWTGLGALLVNGLSIAGIVYSVNKRNYIDATLIFSILFSRFYLGSRQNAYDFAKQYNEDLIRQKIKDLISFSD